MVEVKEIRNELERGCGFRKEGGTYLMVSGLMAACGKLPIPLKVCPCCGGGVKPSLGWTWINPSLLVKEGCCKMESCSGSCHLHTPPERAGLIWIGEAFYKTPEEWIEEAQKAGVSRRIASVPRGFEVGKTFVFVAHRKVKIDGVEAPAIFHVFRPDRIEYVVSGTETQAELEGIAARGLTLVKLVRTDGKHNKLRWVRGKDEAGQTVYTAGDGRYTILSLDNGTLFDVMSKDPGTGTQRTDKYSKAKEIGEAWEVSRLAALAKG